MAGPFSWKLIVTDPDAAATEIIRVYALSGCSRRLAASAFGVTRWTFKRWIKKLGMARDLKKARELLLRRGCARCSHWQKSRPVPLVRR